MIRLAYRRKGCYYTMIGESARTILNRFFADDFSRHGIQNLWNTCPNQMLWEAIPGADAEVLSPPEVLQQLRQCPSVLLFPEPLPSLYLDAEPAYALVATSALIENAELWRSNSMRRGNSVLEIEPLYIVSCDYFWMIVLTTENTRTGDQLCVRITR